MRNSGGSGWTTAVHVNNFRTSGKLLIWLLLLLAWPAVGQVGNNRTNQFKLGTNLLAKARTVSEFRRAAEELERSAAAGYLPAQLRLGHVYGGDRKMVPSTALIPDAELALKWYSAAAAQNSGEAMFEIGMLYKAGSLPGAFDWRTGFSENLANANAWFQKGSALGYGPAKKELGLYLGYTLGRDRNVSEALRLFLEAEEFGEAAGLADRYQLKTDLEIYQWSCIARILHKEGRSGGSSRGPVSPRLTTEQLEQAEKAAADYVAKNYEQDGYAFRKKSRPASSIDSMNVKD